MRISSSHFTPPQSFASERAVFKTLDVLLTVNEKVLSIELSYKKFQRSILL